jgi:hypothetical protein
MTRTIGWPALIAVSAIVAAVTMLTGSESPLRVASSFVFLLVGSGMAWVRLLRIRDALIELTLAVALSIALGVIVTQIMIYLRIWSPEWGLLALICLSVVGIDLQVLQAYRRRSAVTLRDSEGEAT